MNIRSLSNPAQVLASDRLESSKALKSGQSADRDANGQRGPEGDDFRPLTEEEIEEALSKIQGHEGVTKNGLIVELRMDSGQPIITIETQEGQVLKRFTERDLYYFLFHTDKEQIQLLKKTA